MQIDDIDEAYLPDKIIYSSFDNSIELWFKNEEKFNRFQSALLKNVVGHTIDYTIGYTIVGLHITALDSVSKIKYNLIKNRLYEYMEKTRKDD